MSRRPASNSGRISSVPSASCLAPSPFGMSLVWSNVVRAYPIGLGVNTLTLSPTVSRKTGRAAFHRCPIAGFPAVIRLSPPAGLCISLARAGDMHPFPHRYTVTAVGAAGGDVELTADSLGALQSASPREFDGPG